MIKIKHLTIRNFLSIGNVSQAVNFCNDPLTLVLGENLDLGGNDNRNGVGKSSIVNALCYALYGVALTSIRKDNLINKTNAKNMIVTLDFEKDGTTYHIERGRKPNLFKYIVNGVGVTSDKDTDEAQGDSRLTQQKLEQDFGMSHNMFRNIVALNTSNTPFLSMKSAEQREIIEQLLGITKLSEKSEVLKTLVKSTKDSVKEEEFRIKAIQNANTQIENNIVAVNRKSTSWNLSKVTTIKNKENELKSLFHLDVELEISNHKLLAEIKHKESKERSYARELKSHEKDAVRCEAKYQSIHNQLNSIAENICPTCSQSIEDDIHNALKVNLSKELEETEDLIDEKNALVNEINLKIEELDIPDSKPSVYYNTEEETHDHRSRMESAALTLEQEMNSTNPYIEQIEMLGNSMAEIDMKSLNELCDLRDHQEFLLKLLTSKDSFVRKKIIDQNLSYLNKRLAFYLEKIGLPHKIKFQSNLEVEITEHGRDLDFDNLSRGERTRLILSLSWSFRDVYESLNDKINLLFIDELIDSGLDTSGVESSLAALKQMTRDHDRNIFLISHRDELVGRVDNILKVVKEGGFTALEISED